MQFQPIVDSVVTATTTTMETTETTTTTAVTMTTPAPEPLVDNTTGNIIILVGMTFAYQVRQFVILSLFVIFYLPGDILSIKSLMKRVFFLTLFDSPPH